MAEEKGRALKTELKRLIEWATGTILIGIGAGQFRSEVNGVIQMVLELGSARGRLNTMDDVEKLVVNIGAPADELRKYIKRQREQINERWSFDF